MIRNRYSANRTRMPRPGGTNTNVTSRHHSPARTSVPFSCRSGMIPPPPGWSPSIHVNSRTIPCPTTINSERLGIAKRPKCRSRRSSNFIIRVRGIVFASSSIAYDHRHSLDVTMSTLAERTRQRLGNALVVDGPAPEVITSGWNTRQQPRPVSQRIHPWP